MKKIALLIIFIFCFCSIQLSGHSKKDKKIIFIDNIGHKYKSTDNGNTWIKIKPNYKPKYKTVRFFNNNLEEFISFDAGYSWLKVSKPINDDEDIQSFIVFPNPASDYVSLKAKDKSIENIYLEIFDTNGRIVKSINSYEPESGIDIIDLFSGKYYIKVSGYMYDLIIYR